MCDFVIYIIFSFFILLFRFYLFLKLFRLYFQFCVCNPKLMSNFHFIKYIFFVSVNKILFIVLVNANKPDVA